MNKRLAYLDSLRGLAVLLMVQQHLQAWLWSKTWYSYAITLREHPVMLVMNFMGNFAAPVFLLAAGAGAALMNEKEGTSAAKYIKRGAFILICGYILNIASPHWFSPGSWYILHTMGIALIISPLLLRAGTPLLVTAMPVLLILPGFIQTFLSTPLITGNSFMNNYSSAGGILRLALAEGHFPVIPWTAFFIAGILCRRWTSAGRPDRILPAGLAVFTTGGIMAYMYAYGMYFATGGTFFRLFVLVLSIYPPHPPFIMMLAGFSMILFYIFTLQRSDNSLFIRIMTPLGRSSLSWFFIHIIIFNEALRIAGLHRGFSAAGSMLIILIFITCMAILSFYWSRKGFRFGIEWFMRDVMKL